MIKITPRLNASVSRHCLSHNRKPTAIWPRRRLFFFFIRFEKFSCRLDFRSLRDVTSTLGQPSEREVSTRPSCRDPCAVRELGQEKDNTQYQTHASLVLVSLRSARSWIARQSVQGLTIEDKLSRPSITSWTSIPRKAGRSSFARSVLYTSQRCRPSGRTLPLDR